MLPPPSMQELLAVSSFGGLLMSKPLFASIVIMFDVHTSHPRRSDLCQHALVACSSQSCLFAQLHQLCFTVCIHSQFTRMHNIGTAGAPSWF